MPKFSHVNSHDPIMLSNATDARDGDVISSTPDIYTRAVYPWIHRNLADQMLKSQALVSRISQDLQQGPHRKCPYKMPNARCEISVRQTSRLHLQG